MKSHKVNPAQVQKFLSEVGYPATKDELIEAAEDQGADVEVMDALDMIEDKDYIGPTEVNQELRKIEGDISGTENKMDNLDDMETGEDKMNRTSDVE